MPLFAESKRLVVNENCQEPKEKVTFIGDTNPVQFIHVLRNKTLCVPGCYPDGHRSRSLLCAVARVTMSQFCNNKSSGCLGSL